MMKIFVLLLSLTVLVMASTVAWLVRSGRVAYLTLDKRLKVEINGVPVDGEILTNRTTAIVTRRDTGKKHSYLLFFEGDVDSTGDTGSVVDCHEWVAPHFPFLVETRTYPPCKALPSDGPVLRRWPLVVRGNSLQFVTKDNAMLSVVIIINAQDEVPPLARPATTRQDRIRARIRLACCNGANSSHFRNNCSAGFSNISAICLGDERKIRIAFGFRKSCCNRRALRQ